MASSNPAAAARYTPGSWLGVVRSGTVVLLRPDSAPALVDSLWELLAGGPEVHEVLDAVTSASGGSLARLPWFAIVASNGSIQVFLRGEIDLTVDLPAGPVELSGRDVTTWTERRLATAGGFSLTVPGAAAAGTSGAGSDLLPNLPLADGVVLLQGLRMDFTGAAGQRDAPAVPASAAAVAADLAAGGPVAVDLTPDAEAALKDEVLAAAEADIAAGLSDHGASAETVLEFPGDDAEHDGTLHGELEPEPEREPSPEPEPLPEPAEQELTSNYDHLWEQTVMRNIEDAAVREDPDADADPAVDSGRIESDTVESASAEPAPGAAAAEVPTGGETVAGAMTDAAPGAAPEPPAAPRPAAPTALIDSVPWHTGGDRPSSSAARPSLPSAPSPAPAASLPPTAPQAPVEQLSAAQPDADADHDGQTIVKGDLAGAGPRPAGAQRSSTGPDTGPSTAPLVLARVCPQGHANPSTYSQCGRCGDQLPGDGVQVRRPRLGRMRLSTGELIDLDQSLVVGRQPSVSRVQGAVMPKLIQVASPSGDISRSHVEVRLEGWHVMLCDLKATNGTVLVREGQPPRRLAQGEMAILLDGDIAEVGDGISLRFEEIP
ncbi:hypothetical protein NicSoilB4_10660 [Arthrobacter sp. NicSoilB4]|nr:FHA domain-containing protein [Arthrobacter sp. NicSoilB4]BCW66303.1 hypothetical protein NicSoilB4_10660 [Arthrobacter sp. NicSoilB4]